MDWNYFKLLRKEEKKNSALKVVLIVIGAVAAAAATGFVLYKVFKKYFTVTFECGDCESCDENCFDEPVIDEPFCCCDEEEIAAPEVEAEA